MPHVSSFPSASRLSRLGKLTEQERTEERRPTRPRRKRKQSKIPVDRVPAQQTINKAHASNVETAAQYHNWYSENAHVLEQLAAAHAAYNMQGAEFVPGVTAGQDLDTDSSGNE